MKKTPKAKVNLRKHERTSISRDTRRKNKIRRQSIQQINAELREKLHQLVTRVLPERKPQAQRDAVDLLLQTIESKLAQEPKTDPVLCEECDCEMHYGECYEAVSDTKERLVCYYYCDMCGWSFDI
jgi:hypothetical protein